MAIEFNPDILPRVGIQQPVRLATTREGARPEQELPDTGKVLPQDEQKDAADKKLTEAVNHLNDYVQMVRRELQFSIDESSGRTVITVLDSDTREVIRQIPRKEALMLAGSLNNNDIHILSTHT